MNKITPEVTQPRDQVVEVMPLLSDEDRTMVDRVVFSDTPGYLIDDHPWAETLLRRIGETTVVRDYLATFARTDEGARRVMLLALSLARMTCPRGPACAAALSTASWCALSLGRWELADALAIRSLRADKNSLAIRIREMIADHWFSMLLGTDCHFGTEDIRRCMARVLRELTEPRALIVSLPPHWRRGTESKSGPHCP